MANSLKSIRTRMGFTLRDLAKVSGVGVSTIGNFENGRTEVSPEILKKLSSVLRCSEAELLEDDGADLEKHVSEQLRAGVDPVLERSSVNDLEEMMTTFVENLRRNKHAAMKVACLDNIEKFTRAIRLKLRSGEVD